MWTQSDISRDREKPHTMREIQRNAETLTHTHIGMWSETYLQRQRKTHTLRARYRDKDTCTQKNCLCLFLTHTHAHVHTQKEGVGKDELDAEGQTWRKRVAHIETPKYEDTAVHRNTGTEIHANTDVQTETEAERPRTGQIQKFRVQDRNKNHVCS